MVVVCSKISIFVNERKLTHDETIQRQAPGNVGTDYDYWIAVVLAAFR